MATRTLAISQRLTEIWSDPPGTYGELATVDHKKIGKRYLATAMVVLIVGGVEALVMRLPRTGWFAFAPLTEIEFTSGRHMEFFSLALLLLTISTTAGAINFIATSVRLRAPGMSLDRMPLFLWSTTTTSWVVVFSLPALTACLVFLELDRLFNGAPRRTEASMS